jgi:hypothetical protein
VDARHSREDAMAIMAIYRSRDVDRETYNRLRAAVPIEPIPKGAISHHVGFDDEDGLLVVDLWETKAQLNEFLEARLYPGMQELGLEKVAPRVVDVYALWTAGDAAAHNIATPAPAAA